MNKRWIVDLSDAEREELQALVSGGNPSARKVKRANILLMADKGKTDEDIAEALSAGTSTVHRTRKAFVQGGGVEAALTEARRAGGERKLTVQQEATLVALACSAHPPGRSRWTLQLLADALICLTDLEEVSVETVRRRLAEKNLKPWQKKMWCIPRVGAEFVARMEDILELYAEPADPSRPVVCFDESLKQLVSEVRTPIGPAPGRPARHDYEYKREGTAKLHIMMDVNQPWRHVEVTERRGNAEFAALMKSLVDEHYPDADCIRVVLDNLNTHRGSTLYEHYEPAEARRILRKLEFHFTPKHGSWLNMVEIEIGVLAKQCLDQRIGDIDTLRSEVAAWEEQRNASGAKINWIFSIEDARRKMGKLYPKVRTDERAQLIKTAA